MKARGSCPECRLRDVSHVVVTVDGERFERCSPCADNWAYPDRKYPLSA
jgi:hypothetical protein